MTDRELVRLECLKLSHRADRLPPQVIAFAKELEQYVLEHDEPTSDPSPGLKRGRIKKSDNHE